MRVLSTLAAIAPTALCWETSTVTRTQAYSRYQSEISGSTVTTNLDAETKFYTSTRTVTEIPLVNAADHAIVGSKTAYPEQYTTTIYPSPGFTPIKNSTAIKTPTPIYDIPTKRRRRDAVIPRTPRKQKLRYAPNHVMYMTEVQHVQYTTETVTAAAQSTTYPTGTFIELSSTTFTAPAATYYAGCGSDNVLTEWNGTTISRVGEPGEADFLYVEAADLYSCCVACFETLGNFTCGGYAYGGRFYESGVQVPDPHSCQIWQGAYDGESCHPEATPWYFSTGYSSVWSGPFSVGNGNCGQAAWIGTAPSIDS